MAEKIGLISLGCAKNLVNSEQMLSLLKNAGYEISGETEDADAVIINTCGFIESAKMEAIETILEIGQLKKDGKIKKIIVAGCLSQRYQDEITREMPEIDSVVGVGSFGEIVEIVKETLEGGTICAFGDINAQEPETDRVITTSSVWAYLKIAEGCDNRCSYCIIPDLRGRFRSRPMENILEETERLAEKGIQELIVVAQDITRYGTDLYGERRLTELLQKMSEVEGIKWIRLHYLYPDEIDDSLITLIGENEKILKYMDIPIQHISDNILKKMNRRGTGDEIRTLFQKIRQMIPDVVLRTSLIMGLPGEGEEEFEELCDFLREAKIERTGVFVYSPEEGTKAAAMDYTDEETAQHRAELIMEIQADIMDGFNDSRIGQQVTVLCEGFEEGYYYGRSYAESADVDGRILFTGEHINTDEFLDICIIGTQNGEPVGEKVEGV